MSYARHDPSNDVDTRPPMLTMVNAARPETLEEAAFLSGAAVSHLHLVLARENIPHALLRERVSLRAAEACVARSGRSERAGELRDAVQFLQPGDQPGPAGETYLSWRRAVERPVSIKVLHRALPRITPEQIGNWLEVQELAPISRAAAVMQTVLETKPQNHAMALMLADACLGLAFGWSHVMPLLALDFKRADLRKRGDDLRMACYRASAIAIAEVTREAADLTRRADRLRAVAPKLRAKGAGDAVEMFLTREAVAPTALTSLRSDRAARRFCDRLVELGVARELTGRDTFRLYGL